MNTTTKKVFKVTPSQPLNNESYLPCSYLDARTGQYAWLTDGGRVGKGDKLPEKGIMMLVFNKRFPSYNVEIDKNAPEAINKLAQERIDFFKSFPRIARSKGEGIVDSFPSENHKRTFANVYQNGVNKDAALGFDSQQFLFIDEEEIETLTLQDFRYKRNLSSLLDSISGNMPVMTSVCYMLGINPYGMEADAVELSLTKAVMEGGLDNEFKNIMESNKFGDTFLLYTNIAIVKGIIPQTESGFYQFNGNPIAKSIPEVAKHFEMVTPDWNGLKIELGQVGITVEENKKKVTSNKPTAPTVHAAEAV
jgi:hypothetical protein